MGTEVTGGLTTEPTRVRTHSTAGYLVDAGTPQTASDRLLALPNDMMATTGANAGFTFAVPAEAAEPSEECWEWRRAAAAAGQSLGLAERHVALQRR
jgi:hypothetical protein